MSFAHCSISWRPISVEPVKELAHQRVAGQFAADRAGGAGDHVEYSAGIPARFASSASASAKTASGWPVSGPWCSRRPAPALRVIIAAGKFHGVMAAVTPMGCLITSRRLSAGGRNGVAVDALTFFGEPLNKGGGVADFAFGFRQRFSLLEGHQASEIVLILHHKIEPAAQNVRPLFGGQGAPGG